jgi:hypothetical protein
VNRASLVLAAALLLGGCASTPTPSQTNAPLAGASVRETQWTRIELPNSEPDSRLDRAVEVAPDRLVIVGDANRRPTAWSSLDLSTWSAELMPGRGPLPVDATAFLDGVLAIGAGENGSCAHPAGEDAWFRRPALGWVEAAHQNIFCAGGDPSLSIAGSTALVVGTGSGSQAFAWTSVDGLAWVDRQVRFPGQPPFGAVSVGGIGFIAISQTYGDLPTWVGRSESGVSWVFDQPFVVPQGASPLAVVSPNGRTLALYALAEGGLAGFLTPDQQRWQAVDLGPLSGAVVRQLVDVSGQFAAVGAGPPPSLFVSDNGRDWRRVRLPADLPAGSNPSIIGTYQGDRLIVAVNPGDNGGQAQLWISGPGTLAP